MSDSIRIGRSRGSVMKGVAVFVSGAAAITTGSVILGSAAGADEHLDGAVGGALLSPGTGSIDLREQAAAVENVGEAEANSGGNEAAGNASLNLALVGQISLDLFPLFPVPLDVSAAANGVGGSGGSVATTTGVADNTSGGSATVTSGAASAAGNMSTTSVSQSISGAGSDGVGSVAITEQEAAVANAGAAVANSGGNAAVGNASFNAAATVQLSLGSGSGVNTTTGQAANESSGSATITSGAASAVGNESSTTITQSSSG